MKRDKKKIRPLKDGEVIYSKACILIFLNNAPSSEIFFTLLVMFFSNFEACRLPEYDDQKREVIKKGLPCIIDMCPSKFDF